MDFHQLKVFKAVAETRSFTAAAEVVHITQPAVSMQIRQLEEELDCTLVQRERNGAVLTPQGEYVLAVARRIEAEIEALEDDIAALGALSHGRIAIASSDTLAAYVLSAHINEFTRRYPGIDVSILNGTSSEIESMILDHTADIGFLSPDAADVRISYDNFLAYRDIAVLVPERRPRSPEEETGAHFPSGETLLLLEKGTRAREHADEFLRNAGYQPAHIIELGSVAVQLEFAAAGLGAAIVPEYAAHGYIETGRLRPLTLSKMPKRRITYAVKKKKKISAATTAFIETIRPENRRQT